MKQEAFCVETVTLANKGYRLLLAAGLSADQKRSNCGRGGSCAYELLVPSHQAAAAARLLRQNNIPIERQRGVDHDLS